MKRVREDAIEACAASIQNNESGSPLSTSGLTESSPASKKVFDGSMAEDSDDGEMNEITVQYNSDEMDEEMDEVPVWDPRQPVPEDHELQHDSLCYISYHQYTMRESCYSAQTLNSSQFVDGDSTALPYTMYAIAGTQAQDDEKKNAIILHKCSNIGYTQRNELDSDDSTPEEFVVNDLHVTDEAVTCVPDLKVYELPHPWGMVNKVRSCPSMPRLAASWSSDGRVCLWDLQVFLELLQGKDPSSASKGINPTKPFFTFEGHEAEGYALAWAPADAMGKLATGDNMGVLHLWSPVGDGQYEVGPPIQAHEGSIEDISFMTGEGGNVFCTGGSDRSIKIWDIRISKTEPLYDIAHAHDGDVNICQFNPHASSRHLIGSGGDDGIFKVWDTRIYASRRSANLSPLVHELKFHTDAINTVVWSPHERSVVVTAAYDDMVNIWDLSLEADDESPGESKRQADLGSLKDAPQSLMFNHMGQEGVSDVDWHPTVPGLLLSTAQDGLNIFKPYNLA